MPQLKDRMASLFSYWQAVGLAIAPKCGAPFSIMGSSFIIFDIARSREKMGRTYSRLMMGMSAIDIAFSTGIFFSTRAIPKGSHALWASGTQATCSAQGFLIQLGVGTVLYNASLSIFYLCVVALSMTDEKMKKMEWILHAVPLGFSLGTATAGIPLELYNGVGLWCWIASLPYDCENGASREGKGECERGNYAWAFRWAMYYIPIWCCIVLVSIIMFVVVYLVWSKQRASQRFDFVRQASGDAPSLTWLSLRRRRKQRQKQNVSLVSQVARQAAYYILAFYVAWLPTTVMRTYTATKKPLPYWVVISVVVVAPLQGFFNFLVYIRPRVKTYQKDDPEMTLLASIASATKMTIAMCSCGHGDSEEAADADVLDPSSAPQVEEEDPAYALQVKNSMKHPNINALPHTAEAPAPETLATPEDETSQRIGGTRQSPTEGLVESITDD